jgi:hypothetical protein
MPPHYLYDTICMYVGQSVINGIVNSNKTNEEEEEITESCRMDGISTKK